jgi:integrase
VRVRDLTAEHVERAYAQMRREGRSENVIYTVHATLRSAVSYAVKKGYLSADPLARVELGSTEKYEAEPWTPAEWQTFRSYAEGSRYWPLLLLAVDAGMRRGELWGLRWADVDLESGQVTVAHTRTQIDKRVVEGVPKSGKPHTVVLTPESVAVLRAWRVQQAEERLRLGEAWTDTGLVFVDEAGVGLLPDSGSQAFARLVEQAGVRRCRFHDLRHLSAHLGIAAGESIYEVSDRLGHSSIKVTEATYARLLDDARREAAAKRATML